jgi:hypothetical protein
MTMTPGFTAAASLERSRIDRAAPAPAGEGAAVQPALRPVYGVVCSSSSSGGDDGDGMVGVRHTVCVPTVVAWV